MAVQLVGGFLLAKGVKSLLEAKDDGVDDKIVYPRNSKGRKSSDTSLKEVVDLLVVKVSDI